MPGRLCLLCLALALPAMASSEPMLIGSRWSVTEIRNKTVAADPAPTIEFEEGPAVSGSTGVNRFGGGCQIDGARLAFERFRTTRRAGTPEAMAVERAFLDALGAVQTFSISPNGDLILHGADGQKLIAASPQGG